jgi:hypothetical protein
MTSEQDLQQQAHQVVSDLVPRINELVSLSGEALEDEMTQLKAALMQNPNAVALMGDEDIGKLVEALRRITGQAIVSAASKKTASKKTPIKLTKEQIETAFGEL